MSCKEYIDFEIRKGPRKGEHVKIKCGKCILCRIDRRREWTQRLMYEWQTQKYKGLFVTLTYRDEFLGDNNLEYEDVQKFLKRLRKRVEKNRPGTKLKFYAAGEYGEDKLRKHWHLVIFGDVTRFEILKSWTYGGCDVKPIVRNRLRYVLKYLDKEDWFNEDCFRIKFGKKTPPCHHMSNGLGAQYINDHIEQFQDGYIEVVSSRGKKIIPVPRYYRQKYGLPSPPPCMEPDKQKQIEEFKSHGVPALTAYNLVYGTYCASIERRLGLADSYKNNDAYIKRFGYRRFFGLASLDFEHIEWAS